MNNDKDVEKNKQVMRVPKYLMKLSPGNHSWKLMMDCYNNAYDTFKLFIYSLKSIHHISEWLEIPDGFSGSRHHDN